MFNDRRIQFGLFVELLLNPIRNITLLIPTSQFSEAIGSSIISLLFLARNFSLAKFICRKRHGTKARLSGNLVCMLQVINTINFRRYVYDDTLSSH